MTLLHNKTDRDPLVDAGPVDDRVDGELVLRKVTRRFLPLIGLCYIVLYLDRTNIGVAALQMNTELGISASAFGFAAGVYFFTYTLFEPPSNWILSKVGVRRWIARIMITWGIVTMAMATIQGSTSLAIMRLLLGLAEAGFSPGMLYFVSRWFPAARRGYAMSWIVTFICLSGLTTPLSTYILGMHGWGGLSGWRWLFILTGIPAVVLGLAVWRVLRDSPAQAEFLAPAERRWLQTTLDEDSGINVDPHRHSFRAGLRTPRVWVLITVFICFTFALNGYQLWIPQILARFGLTTVQIGWVATIPTVIAIVPMILWMRHSDRTRERPVHFAVAAGVGAAGFLVAGVFITVPVLAIAGFAVAGVGMYSAMAVFITMPASFLTGAALAAGFGLINGFGNFGGYLGPQITGWIRESTGSFFLAVVVFGAALALAALIVLSLRARDRQLARHSTSDPTTEVAA